MFDMEMNKNYLHHFWTWLLRFFNKVKSAVYVYDANLQKKKIRESQERTNTLGETPNLSNLKCGFFMSY